MVMNKTRMLAFIVAMGWLMALVAFSACSTPGKEVPDPGFFGKGPEHNLLRVPRWRAPDFSDDMPLEGLLDAVQASMDYYQGLAPDRPFRFGRDTFTAEEMMGSLQKFMDIMQDNSGEEERRDALLGQFRVYRGGGRKDVTFTGYYEPVPRGSRLPGIDCTVPIYRVPDDMISVDLGLFLDDLKGKRIVGRYQDGSLVPYYSRYDIDRLESLSGRGYEIAWVEDPVEAFFLHIQGSGRIILPDGSAIGVHYAGNNGRPYSSIGRLLIEEGKVAAEDMSMSTIRDYLTAHPEEMDRILDHNTKYVFFSADSSGPSGSVGVPLSAGRSLATDPAYYPPGALAYIDTEEPVLADDGKPTEWKKIKRFVLNQDSGEAISGPSRADLFWGSGDEAGQVAGWMKQNGSLYFIAPRKGG